MKYLAKQERFGALRPFAVARTQTEAPLTELGAWIAIARLFAQPAPVRRQCGAGICIALERLSYNGWLPADVFRRAQQRLDGHLQLCLAYRATAFIDRPHYGPSRVLAALMLAAEVESEIADVLAPDSRPYGTSILEQMFRDRNIRLGACWDTYVGFGASAAALSEQARTEGDS